MTKAGGPFSRRPCAHEQRRRSSPHHRIYDASHQRVEAIRQAAVSWRSLDDGASWSRKPTPAFKERQLSNGSGGWSPLANAVEGRNVPAPEPAFEMGRRAHAAFHPRAMQQVPARHSEKNCASPHTPWSCSAAERSAHPHRRCPEAQAGRPPTWRAMGPGRGLLRHASGVSAHLLTATPCGRMSS